MRNKSLGVWFPAVRCGTGADIFTIELVAGLKERGIRAEISWLPHRAEYLPWSVRPIAPPDWAQVVHVNTWLSLRFVPKSLPVVATGHHCVHDAKFLPYKTVVQRLYHSLYIKRLEARNIARANVFTAVSKFTARRYQQCFGIEYPAVIYNGINFDYSARSKTQPGDPFKLVFVGTASKRKGIDLLAPIMEKLGEKFSLLVMGDDHVLNMRWPQNVHPVGRVKSKKRLQELMQGSDAMILPTRLEGFGLAAVEAMALGLPVISTRGSSLLEVVNDGKTGFLCAQDDVEAFTHAVRRLANDRKLYQSISRAAIQSVKERFGLARMVNEYVSLYKGLVKNPHP